MYTIKCGKLFVEKYNEENKTSLTPKEVFSLLARKAFEYGYEMTEFNNTRFGLPSGSYHYACKKAKEKNEPFPDFMEFFNDFCAGVEDDTFGLETLKKLYGGCGIGKKTPTDNLCTTEFNYCDNIHFTIDERYCSFIGAFFQIAITGGFTTVINDKDVVWLLYKAFEGYYNFLHKNAGSKSMQLFKWNGYYLYNEICNEEKKTVGEIVDEKYKNDKKGFDKPLSFIELVQILTKINKENVNTFQLVTMGDTNISSGYITLDIDEVGGWFSFFCKVLKDYNKDAPPSSQFRIQSYAENFGDGGALRAALTNGNITQNMLDPIADMRYNYKFKDKEENKQVQGFLKKYIETVMTKETLKMAKDFKKAIGESFTTQDKSTKVEWEKVTNSYNWEQFAKSIDELYKKMGRERPQEVQKAYEYYAIDENRRDFREFIICIKTI